MFATYLIGLREGLEATLVVSILVAFLVKSQRRDRLPQVWGGVGLAVALSVLVGWLIEYTSTSLLARSEDRELFEAVTSVAAVVFVTWMIFWMRRAARTMAGELRGRLTEALAVGSLAVAGMAFLAVVREGLETALIFYSAAQGAAGDSGPLLALLAGIASAVAIGVGLYFSALRINLSVFFTWTGALLILVAAGILKYGVHDFQEAGVLPGLNDLAFDISATLDPSTWYAALLAGMFNVTPAPSVLETVAWVAYAVPVLALFLRRPAPPTGAGAPAPSAAAAGVTEPTGTASASPRA
ncbi:iron uptake transporter permease EfeU [Micromonospora sp. WMMD712]|uniref:iron uptake transporter permease EfeU n=1 Tax=Micromonospora sp. WMMD712 TaxID=3016096 RepID=UPI00249C2690|nr:iron uptake transporter permease EfeU [Micromonospora sp. WMMD712]WFE60173.1 FTR1 family protein [Micromonospora sp. WMMD712]